MEFVEAAGPGLGKARVAGCSTVRALKFLEPHPKAKQAVSRSERPRQRALKIVFVVS